MFLYKRRKKISSRAKALDDKKLQDLLIDKSKKKYLNYIIATEITILLRHINKKI